MSNTGPAVPADQLDRLLQPFQRLATNRTTDHGGHGLGLSIVAAIARAHDAPLTLRPAPGGGLTVKVDFAMSPTVGSTSRPGSPVRTASRR
ncbi:hypothetical protein GCM10029964_097030 [Kibdelosporangium lantanae]